MQWAGRVYFVLHQCLDSPDPNESPHQPEEADWCTQGFRSWETLKTALCLLVRDSCIEEQNGKFFMLKKRRAEVKLR